MKYALQYLSSAVSILQLYDGSMPLAAYLKQYFKANPKFGSKDRKHISHLCYVYFRTGHALGNTSISEKVKASLFICASGKEEWGPLFGEDWLDKWELDIEEKWKWLSEKITGTDQNNLFPWKDQLSEGIDAELFSMAHLVQPDLFLRIRPGRKGKVLEKLDANQMHYELINDQCIALPNASKVDGVLETDREVVVQDLSSQRIAEVLLPAIDDSAVTKTVWDCCAASGGKSLLAYDLIKNIQLTVSDVRPSILRNLQERFTRAGIKHYHSFLADLTTAFNNPFSDFKIILCDAPCSGSGTWARTPEQLRFFSSDKIDTYATMQRRISANVIPFLAKDGYLLYITCSVFRKENEDVVNHIAQQSNMQLLNATLLKGYDRKADTMFAALFKKGQLHSI